MEDIVYLNGDMVSLSKAKIPVLDYGFLYGYGLFETMRAYNSSIFRLESHIARLAKSAAEIGITVDTVLLIKAVTDTLKVNELRDGRVRLTVSVGEGSLVPDLYSCTAPGVLVIAAQYVPYADEVYQRGFSVTVSSIRRNSRSPVPMMKTANYMENLLARRQAKAAGFDEALFLNEKGKLAEASTGNIFAVSKSVLKTPSQRSGVLPGITRNVILELASRMGISAFEGDIRLEEIPDADEVFLTNSILEVMPVISLDRKAIKDGRPGVITRRLMTAYKDLVYRETFHQP